MKRWTLVPLALAGAAIVTPRLMLHSPELGFALQRGFSLVCHQQGDRSFFLFAGAVGVCARCLGIYLGAAVGLLMDAPRLVAWRLFFAAAGINAIDRLAELSGFHGNWMFARFLLGIALGTTSGMLVSASIDKVKISAQVKAT